MNEHLEAIEYAMRTLNNSKQAGVIMTRAEEVKAIEKKSGRVVHLRKKIWPFARKLTESCYLVITSRHDSRN